MSKREILEPLSGKVYCLKHLAQMDVIYTVQLGKDKYDLPVKVFFDDHCWNRARKETDPDEAVVAVDTKHHWLEEERVFCERRWEFSKRLPGIIAELADKGCLSGDRKEIFYRQEDRDRQDNHIGWYICAKLDISDRHKNVTLSVRSAHYRRNRPHGIRSHGTRRFYAFLAAFLNDKKRKRKWLTKKLKECKR